jgi:hypothetical protein
MIPGQGNFPEHQKSSQHYKENKAGMQHYDEISEKTIDHCSHPFKGQVR